MTTPAQRIVCPDCGMSTWKDGFGCTLPGCENYGVLIGKADPPQPTVEQEPAQEGRSE